MPPTVALLHSPLTSAAVWGDLPPALIGSGFDVVVPEVLDDDEAPYAVHYIARAALQLADHAPSSPLVLVAHSGAGPLLPQIGFARHAAGASVSGYVFLDAMLPRVPQAATRLELMAIEDKQFAVELEDLLTSGQRFPDWSDADLAAELPDPGDRAMLMAGLRPRSLDFFTEPLPLPEDWPDARCGYLQLSPAYEVPAATAERRGWDVRRESLHHFATLTHPDLVARTLASLIREL
ncbi:MAG TPA: hypothetical protein VMT88_04115 [Actinomycetes bacterium]|nr:hypothetical protein [Actinomycetes bacterium]